jgi:hypothetical protein
VQPLGFRFDVDAVIVDGVAHRGDCPLVPVLRRAGAVQRAAGEVYRRRLGDSAGNRNDRG